MSFEKTWWAELDEEKSLRVSLPELEPGQKVKITVESEDTVVPKKRELGRLKGKIEILPGFYDPIDFGF